MKYQKSIWIDWDSTSKDANICVYDSVYIDYDILFIADGYVSELLPETDEVVVTLKYLHNFADASRAQKEFKAHCLEFPDGVTRTVPSSAVTFISGDEDDEDDEDENVGG